MVDPDLTPWIGTFDDLEATDRLAAVQLVVAGGAVVGGIAQLTTRLRNAHRLGLLREPPSGRIIGVAALKRPDPHYRTQVFEHAGVAIVGYAVSPELGYVVVAGDKRGNQLSGRLVNLIAEKTHEPVFATTDNRTMKSNLLRSGFTRAGREWDGQKGALSLWLLAPR
jgi:hypothetical protein